ncbi:MAG: nuclear transport factor 2 family protein [Actinobacteria bacterium]|nr:nuclear transport factor 2 family protein [Actinomycetota bacterium]
MAAGSDLDQLRRAWEAMAAGDLGVLAETLDPDASWRAVHDGPWNCEGREAILATFSRNLDTGLRGTIEEMAPEGSRVLVGFRPELPPEDGRPLDEGIAYVVVTFRNHLIVDLKGCEDRASALSYMQGTGSGSSVTPGPWPPVDGADPSAPRVNRLVPFVHVDDVARSVDFYRHLGFTVDSAYEYKGRPVWVAVSSEGAELMLTLDGHPIEPSGQGVLFYLYSTDLAGLRERLLAAGIEAGEIEDGSPGPSEEMRVLDPDGYVLMIAQIEP